MATGLQGSASARTFTLRLLEARTTTNSAPSGASAGIALTALDNTAFSPKYAPPRGTLLVYSTAGSATMTVTIRLWGYSNVAAQWFPLGVGADATKGTINAASALGETGTDLIQHAEPVDLVGHFDRLYAEVTAIGGTSTAVNVDLVLEAVQIAA